MEGGSQTGTVGTWPWHLGGENRSNTRTSCLCLPLVKLRGKRGQRNSSESALEGIEQDRKTKNGRGCAKRGLEAHLVK